MKAAGLDDKDVQSWPRNEVFVFLYIKAGDFVRALPEVATQAQGLNPQALETPKDLNSKA